MITSFLSRFAPKTKKLVGLDTLKKSPHSIQNLDDYVGFLRKIQIFRELNIKVLEETRYSFIISFCKDDDPIVTEDNIKLGNTYGLWSEPVSYWKTQINEPKGVLGYASVSHLNAYDVIFLQAKEHYQELYKRIQSIES
jgi:hypothetical protein